LKKDSLALVSRKKARTKAPSSGVQAQQRKRERLEARREARAAALAAQRRTEQRRRLTRYALLAAVVAGAVWFVFIRGGDAPTAIAGHPIETFSTAGVNDHTQSETETVEYETSPPVSGRHAQTPAPCGTHAEPIPDEIQLHSLEHGAVGVQFQPDALKPGEIARIEGIVREYENNVFSAPYPEMEPAIAVTSWGRMMTLDSVDAGAIRKYIAEFGNQPAEPNAPACPATQDESYEEKSPRGE
jgi:hypothetical protein